MTKQKQKRLSSEDFRAIAEILFSDYRALARKGEGVRFAEQR